MAILKNPINFIKKANKSFNLFQENYEKLQEHLEFSKKNHMEMDQLLEMNMHMTDDLKTFIKSFNNTYNKQKEYFYNGEEHLFKPLLDTDLFFQMCLFNNIKLLSYSIPENRIYLKTEDNIILVTNNRLWTIDEIFGRKGYIVPQLYLFDEFVVFDVGMNRGYASLQFANFDSCKTVYGFEIDEITYQLALENFSLNPTLSNKIKPFNFGIYDEECELDLYYIDGYDGISTTSIELVENQDEWVREQRNIKTKKAKVKKVSEIFTEIIENDNITSNIVLKIDTEGSEYKIINDLIKADILDNFDLILGESHLKSERIKSDLDGFKETRQFNNQNSINSFCFIKDKHYSPLKRAEVTKNKKSPI